MSWWMNFRRSTFIIKLRSWEYWPFGIVQFPAMVYWLWLSARARSLVFFSAANPGIPMGGMFGESKFDILRMIPSQYVPLTIRINAPTTRRAVLDALREAGMQLPVIFKPDIGERGYMVKQIDREEDIDRYVKSVRGAFLIQDLVREPEEYGVFYMKLPGEGHGRVTSLVSKEMLSVTGDGKSTLRDLILSNDRAKLQWKKLSVRFKDRLTLVIRDGERHELVSIGNHAMGTRFINANHLITERLSRSVDEIARNVPGFYFGRFDVRCASIEDLYEGRLKIMELNGCGAEPAHIYDTAFSLWAAFRELVWHWRYIFMIAQENKRNGVSFVSHREAYSYYRKFKDAVK